MAEDQSRREQSQQGQQAQQRGGRRGQQEQQGQQQPEAQQEGQQQQEQQGQEQQGQQQQQGRPFQGFGAQYDPERIRRGVEDWRRSFQSVMPPSASAIPLELRGEWTQRHLQAVHLKMENVLRDMVLDLSAQLDVLDAAYVRDVLTRISSVDPNLMQFLCMNLGASSLIGTGTTTTGLAGLFGPTNVAGAGMSGLSGAFGLGSSSMGGIGSTGAATGFNYPFGSIGALQIGSWGPSALGTGMNVHMNHFELLRQVLQRQGSENNRRVMLQNLLSRAELLYSQQFGITYVPHDMNIDARAARLQTVIQEIRRALLTVDTDEIAQQRDRLIRSYTVTIRQLSDQMIDTLHEWTFDALRQEVSPLGYSMMGRPGIASGLGTSTGVKSGVSGGLGGATTGASGVWPPFTGAHPSYPAASPSSTAFRGYGIFGAGLTGLGMGGAATPVALGAWEPRVDIFDCGETMRVVVDLAGIRKEDVIVDIQDPGNRVVLSGNYPDQPKGRDTPIVQERIHGQFSRTITLPYSVDASKTDAQFDNGILELTLTKMGGSRIQLD